MASLPPSRRALPPNAPALRALVASRRALPALLKAVRSEYRRQRRHPLYEPTAVRWIERYVDHVRGERLGDLGHAHAIAFLQSLSAVGPRQRRAAREAVLFLHADLLLRPLLSLPAPEAEANAERNGSGRKETRTGPTGIEPTRSFWTLADGD